MRSLAAADRAAERAARRRQRELERQLKEYAKLQELERAALDFELYENRIELFQTIHHDCSPELSWQQMSSLPEPAKPVRSDLHEKSAKATSDAYKPSVIDRLFRRVDKKRRQLDQQVKAGRKQDDEQYDGAVRAFEEEHKDWMEMRQIAGRILEGSPDACVQAITKLDPFSEISAIGSSVNFTITDPALARVELEVHGEDVIPKEKKYLLKSGRLSSKDMPKSEYYGLYQDYVCSATLRIVFDNLNRAHFLKK